MSALGPRAAGVLMPIPSLPGGPGIGDLGPASTRFLHFLEAAGASVWQILPAHATSESAGHSPYSALSAFALDPLLLAHAPLVERGWLEPGDVPDREGPVDHAGARAVKAGWVRAAAARAGSIPAREHEGLERFRAENAPWLEDFALFAALRDAHDGAPWTAWPAALRDRDPAALRAARHRLGDAVDRQVLAQYLLFAQWAALREEARAQGIRIFGDLPMYVAHDSADVWARRELFQLDPDGQPRFVSGVPPDLFSATGQLWGQPLLDWERLGAADYGWLLARIEHELGLVDLLRIDHFRALSAYWAVPADAETAAAGAWHPGPGAPFLRAVQERLPSMPLVAEDLGDIDAPVHLLREAFDLPGMRVLQFGFQDDFPRSIHLPHAHVEHAVVYTGTHDNDTAPGWLASADPAVRDRVRAYTGIPADADLPDALVRLALGSVARLAVLPMQDVLGLGSEARINRPGDGTGNWRWRAAPSHLAAPVAERLAHLTHTFAR